MKRLSRCRKKGHRWEASILGVMWCMRPSCMEHRLPAAWPIVVLNGERVPLERLTVPDGDLWVTATDPSGAVVYAGPAPVPEGMCRPTVVEATSGQVYTFDAQTIEFSEERYVE